MKTLSELLTGLDYRILQGSLEMIEKTDISALISDSRKATEGALFVCIRGANSDGHSFAAAVADVGAKCLIVEEPVDVRSDCIVLKVNNTRNALALLSAAWFDHPDRSVKVIGITGTKGKTTTTYMIKNILENAGKKVGLIGTIETIIGDEHIPSKNTTPESCVVFDYLSRMRDAGIGICVMEVSSQGLMLSRVDGIDFEIGIFTNISPDHIGKNEHKDFDDYLHCKSLLFTKCKKGIINNDDIHKTDIIRDATCEIETFGFSGGCDYRATDLSFENESGALSIRFHVSGKCDLDCKVSMPGRFSAMNSLAAIAVCRHFNASEGDIKKALQSTKVKGRIESFPLPEKYNCTVLIDYAHNAVSLESLLETLKEYQPKRIVTLFGCGGNRAAERRYEMGEVSGRLSDFTIITSDNPRFEDPLQIMKDIETGIKKTAGEYTMIEDRFLAIKYALSNSKDGDVIVLAGKGHEDYQEIKGKKYPMDERELLSRAVEELS